MRRWHRIQRLGRIFRAYNRRQVVLRHHPIRLWVEVSNRCNLKCTVCPQSTDTTSPRGEMDWDLYRRLVDELTGEAFDLNLSHRGEPLYHPRLPEMIALARSRGIATRLHTNATLLTPEIGSELIEAGLDLISFSFDGYDAASYEAIRRGACFESSLWNILRFLREKQRRRSRLPQTILQVIEHESAGPEAPETFRQRFAGLPLDRFYVKKPHNWAGNVGEEEPGALGAPTAPCTFPWYSATVLFNGQVVPCPQDWYGRIPLGDLNRESLGEVWNGDRIRELRHRQLLRDVEGLPPCDQCDRIRRPTFLGVPTENLGNFSRDLLAGYRWTGRRTNR